jgi:hypothetical protein
LKFKLRYEDGVEEPPSPSLFLGKRVHDALAFFYRHRQYAEHVTVADVARHITETWDEAVEGEQLDFGSTADEIALQRQATDLVEKYLDQRDSDEGVPLAVETPLECPLLAPDTGEDLGVALFGIVDLVLESPLGVVVVDFKTSARSSAPLEITHEIQLSCYAYAFRHVFGISERELQIRSLIKTKIPKIESHRYARRDQRHFQRLFAVIHAYLDDLRGGSYVYRPGWTCSLCGFRETLCRDWLG